MTAEELKGFFRLAVDDPEQPGGDDDSDSLWSDVEIYDFMDQAQKEFVRRTDYISDSTTVGIADTDVTADSEWVNINLAVLKIRRARLDTGATIILPITLREYEQGVLSDDYGVSANTSNLWETKTGTPLYMITDMELGKGRLVPIPIEDDTIKMTVFRLPTDVVDKTTVLEVIDRLHIQAVLLWMKSLAYSKQDAETVDLVMAERFEAAFDLYVTTLNNTMKRKIRGSGGTIEYGGIR